MNKAVGAAMAALIVVSPMLFYNAKEWLIHRDRRHGLNALVCLCALGFECWNTVGHFTEAADT